MARRSVAVPSSSSERLVNKIRPGLLVVWPAPNQKPINLAIYINYFLFFPPSQQADGSSNWNQTDMCCVLHINGLYKWAFYTNKGQICPMRLIPEQDFSSWWAADSFEGLEQHAYHKLRAVNMSICITKLHNLLTSHLHRPDNNPLVSLFLCFLVICIS